MTRFNEILDRFMETFVAPRMAAVEGDEVAEVSKQIYTSYQAAIVSIILRSPTRGTQSWGWWCRRVQTRPTCTVMQIITILQLRFLLQSRPPIKIINNVNNYLCNFRWTGGSRSQESPAQTPCSSKAVLVPETLSQSHWSTDRCCDFYDKKSSSRYNKMCMIARAL